MTVLSGTILATGRRKTSVAQVRLVQEGQGKIVVNDQTIEEYFVGLERLQKVVLSPISIYDKAKNCDYFVKVNGGGISSQAGAVRHGMARAVSRLADDARKVMKKAGFLTRDPRMVERKKPGQPKARKRFQYSKR